MSIETANITFFKTTRCGYYKGHQKDPEFGGTKAMLEQLERWANGKQLAQTQTFQHAALSNGDTALPVYLYNIKRRGDEWLLIVWNEVPATNSQIASVMANGHVGQAQIHMNNVVAGSIPGFATYFWFLPERGIFANIRFQHAAGGHAALQTYLLGYLERFSEHVVFAPEASGSAFDIEIEGYRAIGSDASENLNPRYRSSIYTKPGQHEFLVQNASLITKVLRRTHLELQTGEDLALWQKLWRKVRPTERPATTDPVSLQYEMKASMTPEEVQAIIDASDADTSASAWDDIGFQLTRESSPRWLNKSYARDKFDLDISRENAEIVNIDSLLDAITQKRDVLLTLLD